MASSLSAAVEGMLQECVEEALGPSPPSLTLGKRKHSGQAPPSSQPAPGQEQRCPNVEDTAEMEPSPAKKPRLASPLAPLVNTAAAASAAPALTASSPPAAQPAGPSLPSVDLEAAVCELMGPAGDAPASTHMAEAAQPAAKGGSPQASQPAAPAEAASPLAAPALPVEAAFPQEQGSPEPAAQLPAAAVSSPPAQPDAAPTSASVLPAALPAAPHSAPAAPCSGAPAADHSVLPAAAIEPAALLPPCTAAAAAAAAAVPASGSAPAAASPPSEPSSGRLVRRPAPSCSPPDACPPTASQPISLPPPSCSPAGTAQQEQQQQDPVPILINLLKGDIEQDFDEGEEDGEDGGSTHEPSPPSSPHGRGWSASSSGSEARLSRNSASRSQHQGRGPAVPAQLASYQLEGGREVGSGGLGRVYAAVHEPTGRRVALKLGSAFVREDGPKDFTWSTFLTEWNAYTRLASVAGAPSGDSSSGGPADGTSSSSGSAGGLPWLAEPFEFGLLEDGRGGVTPWLTMELLGPSMHDLNQRHHPAVQARLGAYARGMLDALEGLHSQGLIHNDVKPANFVTQHGFSPSPPDGQQGQAGASPSPQIFLVDFGFALGWQPTRTGKGWDFVGTPDFASSGALLNRLPGKRDDLESLGYTLVELFLGELPWNVTKHSRDNSRGRGGADVTCWDAPALAHMRARREAAWEAQVEAGKVPAWLVEWVEYCQGLHPSATPDYARLRGLIAEGEREAAAAAKAEAARKRSKAWLAEE